ncbi:hypothetical protein RJI07_01700 [Mycoplasmatota bacterium WC30]
MTPQEMLYEKFYVGYYGFAISFALLTAIIILLLIFRKRVISYIKKHYKKPIIPCIVSLFIVIGFNCFVTVKFIQHSKDYTMVQNEEYLVFTGKVIDYAKAREGNDGLSMSVYPIVEDFHSDTIIIFNALGTKLNESYIFYYLENTKIAVIVDVYVEGP